MYWIVLELSTVEISQWRKESRLKGGNVEFAWKVEMSNLLVKGLFGIKAWTNEDNNILLSNLKDLKGFISHFHHNFLIYLNYHHINIIIRYYYDLDFVYKCTFISCFSEFLNFLFFQNFDLIFTFSDQEVHQNYYALIILLLTIYIILLF